MKQLGSPIDPNALAASRSLPLKPQGLVLQGTRVCLEPLDLAHHGEALHEVSNGESFQWDSVEVGSYDPEPQIWRYMSSGPFNNSSALAEFLKPQVEAADGLCFCVLDATSRRPLGVANMMNNVPSSLKVELGNIWYSPAAQGKLVNTEATYLLLKHAFALGYRRVEWKCDSLNTRSRKSALRLGFVYEGQQDSHLIVKGRNRDTSWYRMLDRDWPQAKLELEKILS